MAGMLKYTGEKKQRLWSSVHTAQLHTINNISNIYIFFIFIFLILELFVQAKSICFNTICRVEQPTAVRLGSHCIRLDRHQEIRSEIHTRTTQSLVTLFLIYDKLVPGMEIIIKSDFVLNTSLSNSIVSHFPCKLNNVLKNEFSYSLIKVLVQLVSCCPISMKSRRQSSHPAKEKTWYILCLDECAISKPYSLQFLWKHQFNP